LSTRIIGKLEGKQPGPLVVFVGGIHGNETAGVEALKRVFRDLKGYEKEVTGTIIGLAGNLAALEANRRYIHKDMNRIWHEDVMERLISAKREELNTSEMLESLELVATIEHVKNREYTTKVLVDLHTTSSERGNFIVIPEDESEHPIVKALELPVVVDLEKYLEGTLLQYMHRRGFIAFAFEGGLMGTPEALELHTSGVWELIFATGCMAREKAPEIVANRAILKQLAHELPAKVKVLFRHWVEPEDQFVMKPGFRNFDKIQKGQVLAHDVTGDICAPMAGLIFMPLYQAEGNDGFFIVEPLLEAVNI